jgi:hypothetical protein
VEQRWAGDQRDVGRHRADHGVHRGHLQRLNGMQVGRRARQPSASMIGGFSHRCCPTIEPSGAARRGEGGCTMTVASQCPRQNRELPTIQGTATAVITRGVEAAPALSGGPRNPHRPLKLGRGWRDLTPRALDPQNVDTPDSGQIRRAHRSPTCSPEPQCVPARTSCGPQMVHEQSPARLGLHWASAAALRGGTGSYRPE